jgi:MoxR-like ATPase
VLLARKTLSIALAATLVLLSPGAEAWSAIKGARTPPRGAASGPAAPSALPAAAVARAAASSNNGAQASVGAQPAADGGPAATAQAERLGADAAGDLAEAVYDKGAAQEAVPIVEPPRALGLADAEMEKVDKFTAAVQERYAQQFPEYAGYWKRDYGSWREFIRFFTPEYGVREALARGARYVYRDRLETIQEREAFDRILADEIAKIALRDPNHGKNAALARALTKRGEPSADSLPPDEESPFHVTLKDLVPDSERSKLVMTAEVLNRFESTWQAFAMRDFTLLVGPPAAVKSALPRFLASPLGVTKPENLPEGPGIPYLAVTMHPGIGTFELVGGYRPKELKIKDPKQADAIVKRRLKEDAHRREYGAFVDAASKVYGPGDFEGLRARAEADLDAAGEPAAKRRVVTLAHALRYGESSLAWQDGYLTYALKKDIWITFEELNAAPTEVLEFLNEFMSSRRLIVTQKLGQTEVLAPKPGGNFMLWATMNPETDSNRNMLARTMKSRWRIKHFGDLPSMETAEILEKKFGLPSTWALALVENVHKPLSQQARARTIGGQWRDGYVYNFRHLLRVSKRWKHFYDRLPASQRRPDSAASLALLAREAYSVYSGQIREPNLKQTIFTMLDQALGLRGNNITFASLTPHPTGFEDLGDRIRIGDVEIKKGPGGRLTPEANRDYVPNATTWPRLYEYAKALALGEPILLMGESGVGKTTDLKYLFQVLNYNLHYKNLDSDTAQEEVVGGYVTGDRRGVYVFAEGMLPAAVDEDSAVLLDEINLNPLAEWMNTLIDDSALYLPHRIVRGRPMLTGAANPPEPSRYGGRLLMSPAFRSRWQEFWVEDDFSTARLRELMRSWLGGAAAAFGRSDAGVASWTDAARDLMSRFSKKKRPAEPVGDEPGQEAAAQSGTPSTIEELLVARKIPAEQWPAVRAKIEAVEAKIRMVGATVGRDPTLRFVPGDWWAFWFEKNTITYPLDFLLTHSEDAVVGVVDHEGSHRDITVVDQTLPLARKFLENPERHFLWNAVEDPRVNNWVSKRLPGARAYLNELYDSMGYTETRGEAKPAPSKDDVEKILKGDGGTAFPPEVLSLPHAEFGWAIQYYWRYGKPPEIKSKSARKAFLEAQPHLDEVFKEYPRQDDPTQRQRLAHTLKALETIDEKIWPLYEPLVQRSKNKLAKSRRGNKGGKGKSGSGQGGGQGQKGGARGGNGLSEPPPQKPPQGAPPRQDKKQPGKDGGQGEKKDDKTAGGSGEGEEHKPEKKKRSLWDKLTGKNKDEEEDDGDPEPPKNPDQHDHEADKTVRDLADKAAKDMAGKVPRTANGLGDPRKGGKGSVKEPGDAEVKPLTLADVVATQREQLLNDDATAFQRVYRQVAEAANQMVTHLDNLFVKNSRPGDVGWYRSGRKPSISRAMKLDGQGAGRDDIWYKRVEATKRKYKVTILVDESGSMLDKRHPTLQAAVMLIESLHRLQVDIEIIGFAETAQIHLPYGTPITPEVKERLLAALETSVGARGGTHDADAVKRALDRILAEDGDERIIFVLTDGDGNGPSKLSSVLPQAEAGRVGVIGVGIGPGMEYVRTSYPRHVLVPEYWQLPMEIKKQVEQFIAEREQTALAARQRGGGVAAWSLSSSSDRLPLSLLARLRKLVFDLVNRRNGFILFAAMIVACATVGFSSPMAAGLGLAGMAVLVGDALIHGAVLRREAVPAALEAQAARLRAALPASRAALADQAIRTALKGLPSGPTFDHPWLALVSEGFVAREKTWPAAWTHLKGSVDAGMIAGLIASRSTEDGTSNAELDVLGELGPAGRGPLLTLGLRGLAFDDERYAKDIARRLAASLERLPPA